MQAVMVTARCRRPDLICVFETTSVHTILGGGGTQKLKYEHRLYPEQYF